MIAVANFTFTFIIIILFASSSRQSYLVVFHWRVGDSKSPQVSRTQPNILADLNNAVVWMVLVLPQISKSSSSFSKLLEAVLSAPITIGITVTFMFHSFLSS